ncbi:cyclodeaminase/cyclohydrolase family protein [Anaerosalibacter bizertensis]|nr:cyclodeaminase/cyclohydrolase family protein [Anaerosalibacter bizertensis]MBV1817281.1 cyclodeaminase/cyclohydrolase family protein [Bacteroidales bacterium MSK.15.36]MCB5559961.1 cyclodeaminase/cyclohydrolase family protein [Anaerosalibacter bizertensis]MCG4565330.1 cyclodeaminase/cyclohydrolase family protein [Anaerosalibacter bizertensis]MCG4582939.1 cyclodeaminase/cyclohydrolase family protein [Anaerosalibacter bizertensis]
MLVDKTIKDYVNQVASNEPAPGGGSVSALVGSLGAALTSMVGNLTIGKKAYEKLDEVHRKELDENLVKVQDSIKKLNVFVDKDTEAFNKVMESFKLPKETEDEKRARSLAIEEATKGALETPLECAKECLEVLRLQKTFALYGNPNAITDVGVGALLAYSGLEGALFNVKINLAGLKDEKYIKNIEEEMKNILNEGKKLREELLEIVYGKLG